MMDLLSRKLMLDLLWWVGVLRWILGGNVNGMVWDRGIVAMTDDGLASEVRGFYNLLNVKRITHSVALEAQLNFV